MMIGVFIGKVRIGSLLEFPHQSKTWCAYSYNDAHKSFARRRDAVAWLVRRHKEAEPTAKPPKPAEQILQVQP